jgi:hypothetical protein
MASEIKVDTVSEKTSGSGVTIDGLLIKDGGISGDVSLAGTTPTFTIGDAGAEDAALVFDGNAQDFYIALDDSADDLLIGLGSTVGTTPAIAIDENLKVNIPVTTASTSTSTGSLTTGGGVGVGADLYVGDDTYLITDSAVLGFGADKDTTLTHTDGTGLTLNSTNKLCFNDASQFVQGSSGTVLSIGATDEIDLTATAIDINGTADVSGAFTTGSTIVSTGAITSNAGVVIDNITIDGTEIDLSSGDLTVDVAGDIILDADGGEVLFHDATTAMGHISMDSSNITLKSLVSDKDIIFQGNDGGSGITALTLDMSGAGAATFNNDVTAFSDKRLKTDIRNIENALPLVMKMQGVHYKRNDTGDNPKEQIGVLAQDIEEILPQVVLTADDEIKTKSVDYGKICAVLIEAIKELKTEINELKKG